MGRGFGKLAALAACVAATALVHGSMPTRGRAAQNELFVPRAELARVLALGFDAVVGDYYWMQAIQIVGARGVAEEKGELLGQLIDVVTTLDPHVDHPYRFAAIWLTHSEPIVRKANELLRRGIEYHPGEWRNRFYLGFNHFFYLDERPEAAEALEGAMTLPDAPLYLRRLVARLKSDLGGLEVAETFLHGLLLEAEGEHERMLLETALAEIAVERVARVLDEARERYRARHGRDIEAVEDLARGPEPVLPAIPPDPLGAGWTIEADHGRIVSSMLGHRYEPVIDAVNRARIEKIRARGAEREKPGEEGGAEG